MSSKTLAVTSHAGRTTGAVIESSIGSLVVSDVFDLDSTGPARIPVRGPFDRIVATLEPEAAAFRILTLPFRDRRRISQAVGPALEGHVPLSLDDGVLAWDFTRPAAATSTVLAAIAETSRVAETKARLVELGIDGEPQKLLWAPSVIVMAYRHAVGERESFSIVDFGDGGALVARIEEGSLSVLRVLAPCDDELLLRNVAWSLAAVPGDPLRTFVGGRGGSRLIDALRARLPEHSFEPLPVRAPVQGFEGRDWREMTSLAGLLLAASGDAISPVIDMETGAGSIFGVQTLREIQSEAGPVLRWAAAAAILAVIAVGIDYVQLFAERRILAGRAEQIYASAMPSGSGGAGRKIKMEMRLRELSGKAETAGTGGGGSPLSLLAALSRDIPKSLDVVVDQVDHAPPSAKVAGHADSFEAVTKMQDALEKGGAFSRVEVKDVHAAVSGTGVEFLLELTTNTAEAGA
ncbi:MAG TPA: hypothetical protein VN634_17375 [Candidatus Limnocylindrales bacterium]|nr:hypothetical protein [Candidatus Limnocylindrales bacterium]